jgi:hypothetical protein
MMRSAQAGLSNKRGLEGIKKINKKMPAFAGFFYLE